MTMNVTTVLPESGGAPPPVRTTYPLLSAAGVNDLATISRQQLMNAVPAPALVPGYAGNVVAPPKNQPATAKPTIAPPSSALAAQFIAQAAPEDMLAMFEPRAIPLSTAEYIEQGDDFLAAMRMARGETAAPPPPAKQEVKAATQQQQAMAEKATMTAQTTTARAAADGGLHVSLAAHLPAVIAPAIRTATLTQVRGVSAYQLAESRNAKLSKPSTVQKAL